MNTKLCALMCVFLVATLPIAFAQVNVTNATSAPALTLTAQVPTYVRDYRVDVSGTSLEGVEIELFINDVRVRVSPSVPANGIFLFNNVPLPQTNNTLELVATDSAGNTISSNYSITVDKVPPYLNVTIPSLATDTSFVLNGTVSEPVTLRYRLIPGADITPPDVVDNLTNGTIDPNTVDLMWAASSALDILGYAVYRDDVRIATVTDRTYTDPAAYPNAIHVYRVSAIDQNCNEGGLSFELRITSANGTVQAAPTAVTLEGIGCTVTEMALSAGPFGLSFTLLADTLTYLELTALDSAGHLDIVSGTVTVDTSPPQFIDTNLEEISPSYMPDVTIRGQLSEQASVFVYINNATTPNYVTASDANGLFSVDIELVRDIQTTLAERRIALETGVAWDNTIRLVAVDLAGRNATYGPVTVKYALCGFGTWYRVDFENPLPDVLTPRLLLQGIQQVGIPVNITYRGGHKGVLRETQVRVNKLQPSPEVAGDYDNDWIQANIVAQKINDNTTLAYLQVLFSNVPDPLAAIPNATTFEKEENLSLHREGTCLGARIGALGQSTGTGGVSGVGCARVLLELEIPFQEEISIQTYDPRLQRTLENITLENRVQRMCIPLEFVIDRRIPPDIVPTSFLNASIRVIDRVVDAMDSVLDPLTTVGTYLLYACVGSSVWLWGHQFTETFACDITPKIPGTKWAKEIAEVGLCEEVYAEEAGTDTKNARAACLSCQRAIESRINFERGVLQKTCDRVACPSAPTLQSHIKSSRGKLKDITEKVNSLGEDKLGKGAFVDKKVYAGNDCAFANATTYNAIKKIYIDYKKAPDFCKETLRPANPKCCGRAYMDQWGTACGFSSSSKDTFDEIKESACLAAQKANQVQDLNKEDIKCKSLWNAAAGFCEPKNGTATTQVIPTGMRYKDVPAGAATNEVYLILSPKLGQKKATGEEYVGYNVQRGYVAQRFVLAALSEAQRQGLGPNQTLNAKMDAVVDALPGHELSAHFQVKESEVPQFTKVKTKFKKDLCAGNKILDCTDLKAKAVFEAVTNVVSVPDKEYIVVPESSFARSLQCMCIPAVTSYLSLWRNILGTLSTCFNTIMLTGSGSSGVCEAFISRYACEMVYELVSCTSQYYGVGGGTRTKAGSFGDVFGALTGAGTTVSQRIRGRYGESGLWKTLMVERKMLNSACLFAFTGSWDLDVSALLDQTIADVPIESQGILAPCERRFGGYNPVTFPRGLTSWTYHFGVGLAAGANLRYNLELQCSRGFTCNPADGFKNGECDCNKNPRPPLVINPPELGTGQLSKNDILNVEVFHPIQAGPMDSQVRYDRAVFRWEYTDPKTQRITTGNTSCSINLVGGNAPVFCSFDPFSLAYRCQFGLEESGVQLKNVEPKYPHTVNATGVFGFTDTLEFKIDVRQTMPSDPTQLAKGKKFVTYQIFDQTGGIVAEKKRTDQFNDQFNYDVLKQAGDYSVTLPINVPSNDMETALKKGVAPPAPLAYETTTSQTRNGLEYIGTWEFKKKNTPTPGKNTPIPAIIVLEHDKLSIYEVLSTNIVAGQGFGENTAAAIIKDRLYKPEAISITPEKYIAQFVIKKRPKAGERVELLLTPPPTAVEYCKEPHPKAEWTAKVVLYDADDFGMITDQISIDPVTGTRADKTVPFKVMCKQITVSTTIATP